MYDTIFERNMDLERTPMTARQSYNLQLKRAYQIGDSDAVADSMLLRPVENPYPVGSELSKEYEKGFEDAVVRMRAEYRLYGKTF